MEKVDKSEQDWRGQLTAEQYQVARCSATEMPFSGEYWDHHEDGVYFSVCSETPLFDSRDKFDSGSEEKRKANLINKLKDYSYFYLIFF